VQIESANTLVFNDCPASTLLLAGQDVVFTTSLVGYTNCPASAAGCVNGIPSVPPLMTWQWLSSFNGSAVMNGTGGVSQLISQLKSYLPIDPNSGTGGVTLLSVNGIQLKPFVSSQIATTASGLAYSRVTQTFNGTVTITNISGSVISGPFQIVFFGLPTGVKVANQSGWWGSPVITMPGVATLASGQSVTISVQFKNPSNAAINLTPVIYSGSIN
jgi:hypothetical protein